MPKLKKITEIKVKATINLSPTQIKPIQLGTTYPICKMQNARLIHPEKRTPNKKSGSPLVGDLWASFRVTSDSQELKPMPKILLILKAYD